MWMQEFGEGAASWVRSKDWRVYGARFVTFASLFTAGGALVGMIPGRTGLEITMVATWIVANLPRILKSSDKAAPH